jgi:hypothetical protein
VGAISPFFIFYYFIFTMGRKIHVFNMGDNSSHTLPSSNASTWGDVLRESSQIRGMVSSDMKVVIKQTRTNIETESAVLPNQDITIYLTPGKVKAGAKDSYRVRAKAEAVRTVAPYIEAYIADLKVLREALVLTVTN